MPHALTGADDPGPAERHRPQLHFTPARHWLNDPNGLVFHRGLWHLFFQHNPSAPDWGDLSWGHATSPDLLHWTERPVALLPRRDAAGRVLEHVFSGCVVSDAANSSGLGTAAAPPLVAVFTSACTELHPDRPGEQVQSLASSLDDGETWTPYDGNPVLARGSRDFRDPKVLRYDGPAGRYWVMVAVEAVDRAVLFFRSDDLLTWEHLSTLTDPDPAPAAGQVWECPDLFELPVEGRPGTSRWVLVLSVNPGAVAGGSGTQYLVGDFDGTTFTPDAGDGARRPSRHGWLDHGRDHYAAVSWSGAPGGRRVMIGWMSNWDYAHVAPTVGWRGGTTLPRDVRLVPTPGGPRLAQAVVGEVESLRRHDLAWSAGPLDVRGHTVLDVRGRLLQVDLELDPGDADAAGVDVLADGTCATRIGYDARRGDVVVDRRRSGDDSFHPAFASVERAPVALDDGRVSLRVYVDEASVEVFTADGHTTLTDLVLPPADADGVALWAEGGTARVERLVVTPLSPIVPSGPPGPGGAPQPRRDSSRNAGPINRS